MWKQADIEISIEEAEHPTAIVRISTQVGTLELIGEVFLEGSVLIIRAAHVQGLRPGALGRAGLNAIARRMLEESGATSLILEGAPRTTGAHGGRRPHPIRFPR